MCSVCKLKYSSLRTFLTLLLYYSDNTGNGSEIDDSDATIKYECYSVVFRYSCKSGGNFILLTV